MFCWDRVLPCMSWLDEGMTEIKGGHWLRQFRFLAHITSILKCVRQFIGPVYWISILFNMNGGRWTQTCPRINCGGRFLPTRWGENREDKVDAIPWNAMRWMDKNNWLSSLNFNRHCSDYPILPYCDEPPVFVFTLNILGVTYAGLCLPSSGDF